MRRSLIIGGIGMLALLGILLYKFVEPHVSLKNDNQAFLAVLAPNLKNNEAVPLRFLEPDEWAEICYVQGDDSEPTSQTLLNEILKYQSGADFSFIPDQDFYLYFRDVNGDIGKIYSLDIPLRISGSKYHFDHEQDDFSGCLSFNAARFSLKGHRDLAYLFLSEVN